MTNASLSPPSKHQQALMVWLAVFPTLVALNTVLSRPLDGVAVVPRTFVLVTIAVPIVIYGLMPRLHRLRASLVLRQLHGHERAAEPVEDRVRAALG